MNKLVWSELPQPTPAASTSLPERYGHVSIILNGLMVRAGGLGAYKRAVWLCRGHNTKDSVFASHSLHNPPFCSPCAFLPLPPCTYGGSFFSTALLL